jgi:hypothetical protein
MFRQLALQAGGGFAHQHGCPQPLRGSADRGNSMGAGWHNRSEMVSDRLHIGKKY